jgi:cell division protein FtsI (penicillin-binding protein 3)
VEDGAVVAMSNVPGYDNNRFGEVADELQRNRTLTDPYEPGSTFKAFTTAAALEEGAVAEDTAFVVPDSIAVADRVIHDSQAHETKTLTTGDILVQSSNVGTIQVAQSLGGERLYEYIKRFGFGEQDRRGPVGRGPGRRAAPTRSGAVPRSGTSPSGRASPSPRFSSPPVTPRSPTGDSK